MLNRRTFTVHFAAAIAAARLMLSAPARAAVTTPAPPQMFESLTPFTHLQKLYLAYLHAKGQNARRYDLNMQILAAAHTLKTQRGWSIGAVNQLSREARLQAKIIFDAEKSA